MVNDLPLRVMLSVATCFPVSWLIPVHCDFVMCTSRPIHLSIGTITLTIMFIMALPGLRQDLQCVKVNHLLQAPKQTTCFIDDFNKLA